MTPLPPVVTPLRRRPGRITATVDERGPRKHAGATGGTVRALTAALAPHLSTADPELHGLAATLLTAQQDYALSVSDTPGATRDEVRHRYFEAARDYCEALERRGLALPPGLLEAEHWLADRVDPADD
ncbi:hypothetical protein [Cryptosporangium aurantiacum]|uniref:Uncharacterized protein n=1 Tax=Cryptosporangium aurantiacum TaxID=134849 RepID=A0A1M7RMV9_9ACTN|nr:hypothetical protein [Cryptosporangium aurantiacum]SHN47643.1 hypothetical protein SAMN05443668_12625 [Cryptosporangium aurantiacum]